MQLRDSAFGMHGDTPSWWILSMPECRQITEACFLLEENLSIGFKTQLIGWWQSGPVFR